MIKNDKDKLFGFTLFLLKLTLYLPHSKSVERWKIRDWYRFNLPANLYNSFTRYRAINGHICDWRRPLTYLLEKVRSILYSCSKHEKGFIPIQYSVGIITKQCTLGLINDFKHFLSFWQSNRNNIRFGTTGCIFKSHFISLSHYREARSVDSMCKSFSCCTFIGPFPYPPLPIWPPSEFHPESPWPVNCCFYDVHFYSGIWFYRIECSLQRRICPFTVYIQIVRIN